MSNTQSGDIRIRSFIHPDSINVRVWVVEQYVPATGKYAKAGDMYWRNVTPGVEQVFDSEAVAMAFAKHREVLFDSVQRAEI